MLDSGPVGLSMVDVTYDPMNTSAESDNVVQEYRSLAHSQAQASVPTSVSVSPRLAHTSGNSTLLEPGLEMEIPIVYITSDGNNKPPKRLTMANVVSNGEWKQSAPLNEWTLVQNKKSRSFAGKKGIAVSNSSDKFRAADLKIPLFITYVNKETEEQDICEYIKTKTGEIVSLEKIKIKKDRSYSAFKCYVSKHKLQTFLDDQLWPVGIVFRRFVRRRYDINIENRHVS